MISLLLYARIQINASANCMPMFLTDQFLLGLAPICSFRTSFVLFNVGVDPLIFNESRSVTLLIVWAPEEVGSVWIFCRLVDWYLLCFLPEYGDVSLVFGLTGAYFLNIIIII